MSDPTHVFGFPISLANVSGPRPQIEKGTGNPNGVLSRPIGSLFLRTDTAQLWQNTNGGTTWTQAAGGTAGSVPNPTPNDYLIELGAASDMGLGYFLAATTGLPADTVALGSTSATFYPVSGNNYLPWLRLATNSADYTGPGVGGTGYVFIGTGDASATAGGTGGTTGYVLINTGAFTDGAGTGGQSGFITLETGATNSDSSGEIGLQTGDSTGSDSGELLIQTGNAGDVAGNISITAGDGGVTGGNVPISAGTSGGGVGGSIILTAGSGTTNSGDIRFESGIRPTPNIDTASYNNPLAYGIYKSRTYITGTGPGVSTLQFIPQFQGEIEMVLVRNANVGAGDTLAITVNGTNVFAPSGVAGPLTQAGGSLISGDQFLPRLNGSGTIFSAGNTIQVTYSAAGASGGAMVNIFVRQRL